MLPERILFFPTTRRNPQTNIKLNAILVLMLYLHGCVLEQRIILEKVFIFTA